MSREERTSIKSLTISEDGEINIESIKNHQCTVLICGGRTFCDHILFNKTMDKIHKERGVTHVLQGGAKGADYFAHVWSAKRGIRETVFNAEWKKYGKSAGPIRNRVMLDEGRPDLVVAFPGGTGTAHMVAYAWKKGIETIVVELKYSEEKLRSIVEGNF